MSSRRPRRIRSLRPLSLAGVARILALRCSVACRVGAESCRSRATIGGSRAFDRARRSDNWQSHHPRFHMCVGWVWWPS